MNKRIVSAVVAIIVLIAIVGTAYVLYFPPEEPTPEDIQAIMEKLPDYYPKDYWKIIQGAEEEGNLVFYYSMGAAMADPLVAAFKELYPFISVEAVRLSATVVWDKFYAEMAVGRPEVDVLNSDLESPHLDAIDRGYYVYYESPELGYYPGEWYEKGLTNPASWANWYTIAYNKEKLSPDKIPSTHEAVIEMIQDDPDFWRNKIITYNPLLSGDGYKNLYLTATEIDEDTAIEYYKALASVQTQFTTSSGEMMEKVGTGERWLALDLAARYLSIFAEKYPVIDYALWSDYMSLRAPVSCSSVVKDARHPNAAKLWIDFILSEKAQTFLSNPPNYLVSTRTGMNPENVTFTIEEITELLGSEGAKTIFLVGMDAVSAYSEVEDHLKTRYTNEVVGG